MTCSRLFIGVLLFLAPLLFALDDFGWQIVYEYKPKSEDSAIRQSASFVVSSDESSQTPDAPPQMVGYAYFRKYTTDTNYVSRQVKYEDVMKVETYQFKIALAKCYPAGAMEYETFTFSNMPGMTMPEGVTVAILDSASKPVAVYDGSTPVSLTCSVLNKDPNASEIYIVEVRHKIYSESSLKCPLVPGWNFVGLSLPRISAIKCGGSDVFADGRFALWSAKGSPWRLTQGEQLVPGEAIWIYLSGNEAVDLTIEGECCQSDAAALPEISASGWQPVSVIGKENDTFSVKGYVWAERWCFPESSDIATGTGFWYRKEEK